RLHEGSYFRIVFCERKGTRTVCSDSLSFFSQKAILPFYAPLMRPFFASQHGSALASLVASFFYIIF
ncbi:MAG: hypothetical protein ACRC3Z_06385, partial [Phocaeicola sp.]